MAYPLLAFGVVACAGARGSTPTLAPSSGNRFTLSDIFRLEWADNPRISPNGSQVVFERWRFDSRSDQRRVALWVVGVDGSGLGPLPGAENARGAVWSHDGTRLLYAQVVNSRTQLFSRDLRTGRTTQITQGTAAISSPSWSPDDQAIAVLMFVQDTEPSIARLPAKPADADWGPPFRFIERVTYRRDGYGYLPDGHWHVFIIQLPSGALREITNGPFDDGAPQWMPDGKTVVFSANRSPDWEYSSNTEVYAVPVSGGDPKALTHRAGPDNGPAPSPDGSLIAYTGYDDHVQGYQISRLYLMNADGSGSRVITGGLDRDVVNPTWSADGRGLAFQYDDSGDTKLGYVTLDGDTRVLVSGLGGTSLDRPYPGGSFSVSRTGEYAVTGTSPDHPADVFAVGASGAKRLTQLTAQLFRGKDLGAVETIHYASAFDQRSIEGWIIKPPGFDPSRKYPLVLEIHGGPYLNYGPRFGAELQLYAAAGYVVLYTNPRGSTSYGEQFGNFIHLDYPDHDYDDLMTGVDTILGRGYVDPSRLYVVGGSGGGVLTAWIVGHTHRFRAAVVAKPVINWYSFTLASDAPGYFYKYWMPGFPWQHAEEYLRRSPISYVDSVTTPTMVVTGERDLRTPSEEAEQFYEALKLRRVPAAMLRIPNASHDIAERPGDMMGLVAYTLGWFARYGGTAASSSTIVGVGDLR